MSKYSKYYSIRFLSSILFIMTMYMHRKLIQRKIFAYVFGKCIVPGMTKRLQPYKKELFLSLNSIVSNDPKLGDLGPGVIRILEIGVGSGTNLHFYPPKSHLISVEPNPYFKTQFSDNKEKFPDIIVESFVIGKAENMSDIEDSSVDVVVSTLVLCSVDDLESVLKEIKRVLCPGGKFYYLEHIGYEKGTWRRWLQGIVEPIWKLASDGCRLTVSTSRFIQEAGFSIVDEKETTMEDEFFVVRRNIIGIATVMKS